MKKVVMLIYTEMSQDVRVDKEVETLIRTGHNVEVLSFEFINKENKKGYRRIKLTKKNKLLRFIEFLAKTYKELKNGDKVDVIHSHDIAALPLGYILSKLLKTKFIFDAHELYHTLNNYKRIKKYLLKFFIPKTDFLITVNDSIKKIYLEEFKAKKATVLKNTPNFPLVNPQKLLLRSTLGINETDKILLFQGYIVPHKGVETLIHLLARLPENFIVVFMGKVEKVYYEILIKKVEDLNLSNRVYFQQAVEYNKIYSYTRDADIGVYLPDISEENNFYSLPNKIFEYLSCNIPILVPTLPELSKLVKEEKVGLIIDLNRNYKELATEIVTFFERKDSFKFDNKKYHWSNEQEELIKVYNEVLRGGN